MTFLKKLGQVLLKVTTLGGALLGLPILQPLLGAVKTGQTVQTGLNDLTAIGSTVLQIETALNGKTGTEKLQAAVNLIGPIIQTSELVSGKKITNEAGFQKAVIEITQGMVDLLNSIDESEVKTA